MLSLVSVDPTTGNRRGPLPDVDGLEYSPIFSDAGVVKFSYPADGVNANWLAGAEAEVAIMLNGAELDRFIVNEDDTNEADEAKVKNFTGTSIAIILERGVVYPMNWPATNPPQHDFTSVTAGAIIRTLVLAAQARGALSGITVSSFSSTLDSNGQSWGSAYTVSYSAGTDLLAVLRQLVDVGLCEFQFVGRDLRLYKPGTLSTDRTLTNPPLVFRKGVNTIDSPRKKSSRDLRTTLLVAGADNKYVEVNDATAVSTYGRREGFDSQGNVSDTGTLTSFGQSRLDIVKNTKMEKTHGLVFDEGPQPFVDFFLGDWCYTDLGDGNLERLRIKQIVVKQRNDGGYEGAVVLNDLFAELEEKLVKKVAGIIGGTTVTGGSEVEPLPKDTVAPSAPTIASVTSSAYTDANGQNLAQITVTWNTVTTNTDATVCDDLDHYIVEWNYGASPAGGMSFIKDAAATVLTDSPLRTGQAIKVRVRAYDRQGNASAWSTTASHTTATDSAAPPTPSTPTIASTLGVLTVTWNGLGSASEAMPADFKYVEIHRSTTNGFTPSAATLVGTMDTAGVIPFAGLTYDTTYYFKLRAVDINGNTSAASAQGSGTPTRLVGTDIVDNSLTYKDFTYKDEGNLIPDGSFEDATVRARRTDPNGHFVYGTGLAQHGDYALTVTASGATSAVTFDLTDQIPVIPGQKFWGRFQYRGTATVNGYIILQAVFTLNDNSTVTDTFGVALDTTSTYIPIAGTLTVPANAKLMKVYFETWGLTAGVVRMDSLEVRPVVGTVLIDDAAITTAKIQNAAITTAKIGDAQITSAKINDVTADKITTGTLTAVITMSGTIRTAASGARVVIDSAGIEAFNSGGTKTFDMNSADGSVEILGTLKTGASGQRIEIQAGTANTIKFFSGAGSELANGRMWTDVTGSAGLTVGRLLMEPPRVNASLTNHPQIVIASRTNDGSFDSSIQMNAYDINIQAANAVSLSGTVLASAGGSIPFQFNSTTAGDFWFDVERQGADFLRMGRNNTIAGDNSVVMIAASRGLVLGTWDGSIHSANSVRSFTIRDFTAAAGTAVHVDSNGVLRKTSSSLRYKQQVSDLIINDDWIDLIRPVMFKENGAVEEFGEAAPFRYGFIAEEVAEIPGLDPVVVRWGDEVETVQYDRMVALLVLEIRSLRDRITALEP